MPSTSIAYPLINGNRYDHSSHSIKFAGVAVLGVKALDYNDALEPGMVYGTGAAIIGRTRGTYSGDCTFEVFRAEYDQVIVPAILAVKSGAGLFEIEFTIDVNILAEGVLPAISDKIVGCRIKKVANATSSGGHDANAVKVDCSIIQIQRNGVVPVTGMKAV